MMKKNYLFKVLSMAMVAMMSVGFTACGSDDDPDEVSVSTAAVTLAESGGSQTVTVKSNTKWTISGAPSWLTVAPGQGSGNGSFTVSASANTESGGRSCTLYVSAGDASTTVNVTQVGRTLDLADRVAGTYSGRLKLGDEVREDAYIIKVTKQTSETVTVDAPFFGGDTYNFNLTEQGNQIIFSNSTISNFSMVVMGNQMTVNYLSNGGNMLTYTGTK